MTLKDLMQGRPTLDQYTVLQNADRLLPCGRYYGGAITEEQRLTLDPPKAERGR